MRHAYIDEYSYLNSPLHRLDPKTKAIAFFAFILLAVFTKPHSFLAFSFYGLLVILAILIGRVPFRFVLSRSLVVVPFVVMVAAFIPFLKKGQVIGSYSFGSLKLSLTYEGVIVFWNCLIKAVLSAATVVLLLATTPFPDLLKALERLKVPRIMVMIISFMYRYIFIIQDDLMRMVRAKSCRSVGGSRWFHTKALANLLGALFLRSYERAERVYLAMASRGFDGEIKTLK